MKKIFLFLILLFASSAEAQSAKVLVCAPGNLAAAKSTDSILAKFYTSPIDISDTITEAINKYEAVFLLLHSDYNSQDTLTLPEENLLKNFLTKSRKLYIEHFLGVAYLRENDSLSFWRFIGIRGIVFNSLEYEVKAIVGDTNTFLGGIHLPNNNYLDGQNPTFGGGFEVLGNENFKEILFAECAVNNLALVHSVQTDSFKIVLHTPAYSAVDYREPFLHRVICNYFGLCTSASVKQTAENTAADISLFPNPARDMLHIFGSTGLQLATLYSETGSFITRFSFDPNANRFELDLSKLNLTSGNYLLNIETPKESFSKKVFLLK